VKTTIRLLAAPLCALLVLAAAAAPAGAGAPVAPDDVEGPVSWGAVRNVTRLDQLWFAGQPDRAGLEAARAAGIEVVINLRAPWELRWDERSAVEALGMSYYNVPVTGRSFDPKAFARVEELVSQNRGKEILIHCASSTRAGGWLATHLVRERGMSVDDALAVGRRTGISGWGTVSQVHAFLGNAER